MRKPRKNDTPVENVAILRRHRSTAYPFPTSATSFSCRRRCSTSGGSRSSGREPRPSSIGPGELNCCYGKISSRNPSL